MFHCKYDTLYHAKFCMTLCITSWVFLKIVCMTQKCMTQKVWPPSVVFCVRLCVALHILGSCRNITWLTAHCNVCSFCTWWKKVRTHSIWKRWHFVGSYRLRTRISFSSESSLPLRAFLSITLIANSRPGCSLLSANRTCEKAPLEKKERKRLVLIKNHILIINPDTGI